MNDMSAFEAIGMLIVAAGFLVAAWVVADTMIDGFLTWLRDRRDARKDGGTR